MISSALTGLERQFRQAAARRRYVGVSRLAAEVGAAAAAEASVLPPGDPAVREIGEWLQALYKDVEILVRIGRAEHAAQLRRTVFLRSYLTSTAPPSSRIRLQL